LQKDVAPIVGIVVAALGWMTYKSVEHARAPDVFFNPARRSADVWEEGRWDEKEAADWHKSTAKKYRHKDDSIANLSAFEWTRSGWWTERKEVAAAPEKVTAGGKTVSIRL
jgi:hypothetical protein